MGSNVNIGTINGLTIDQILDKMVERKIGIAGSGGGSAPGGGTDYTGIIDGAIALGGTVRMANIDWTIVHIDPSGGCFYMCKTYVEENINFGNSTNYYGSTAANKCQTFYNSLPENVKNVLMTVGIFGVQQKVFIPRVSQISGTIDNQSSANEGKGVFNYFTDRGSRVAYDKRGNPMTWWTSTPSSSSNVWFVTTDGSLNYNNYPTTTYGFRPFVALRL